LGATERVCVLVQRSCWTLSTSLLTNQQFINCAFLENTSPCTLPCLPAPCACTLVYLRSTRGAHAARSVLSDPRFSN
jgi:hypothetical protein